jgi:hypothetical protein
MLEIFKQLWVGWNRGIRAVMRVQSQAIMAVAYFFAIGPIALLFRLAGRTLLDRGRAPPNARSFWVPRTPVEASMKDASKPF